MKQTNYHVFDCLIEGVQIVDSQWRYVYVNKAVALQAKSSVESLLGKTMMEQFPGIENTEMFQQLKACMKDREPRQIVNEFAFPDGSRGWFELSMQPVSEGVLVISFDISELKNAQVELREKLMERTEMLIQIERQKKQLEEFCHIISHNLRAPLANLLLLSDMVQDSPDMDEKLTLMGKQKPVIDFLHEIFEELVDATQIKLNHQIKKDLVVLEECLDRSLQLLQGEIMLSEASIDYDFSEIPSVYFPRIYLESVIFNLLSNAIKYRAPERPPRVRFRSYLYEGWVCIEVSDNGLGIDMKRYGDKLFKLRKTFHDHPNAKGLGLFMSKTQIEALGGTILAQSQPGEGSTFTARLYRK